MEDADQETVMWAEAFAAVAAVEPDDRYPLHGECLACWLSRALPLEPCLHHAGTAGMRLTRLWGREHAVRWSPQRKRMLRRGLACDCAIAMRLSRDNPRDLDRACPDCEHGRCSRRCCDGSLTGVESCGCGDY